MLKQKKPTVVIIGAGFAGLAAAGLLAKDGYSVTVLEKNAHLGGRAAVLKSDGFTFDMGPSWYLFQDVFERWFAEFGKKPSEYYSLTALDPQYRVYFDDGTHEDVYQGAERNAQTFDRIEAGAGNRLRRYLADGKKKYELAINHFLYQNFDSLFDLLKNWELLKRLPTTSIFEPMDFFIKRYFSSKKLQQILEYNLIFLGCSPKNAPSLYSMMAHVDMNLGVEYPAGGMSRVVDAMVEVCRDHGVKFIMNSEVTELTVSHNTISAVKTKNKTYTADHVLATGDYEYCEHLLSDQSKRMYSPRFWEQKVVGPSAFILYLGVTGKIPELLHHTFYFSDAWEQHFASIFSEPSWPHVPSIYINNPTATDPTLAPPDHEALMILVPIAAGLKDHPTIRTQYTEHILSLIEKKCHVSLRDRIVFQKSYSLTDFTSDYHSYKGNAFGGLANTFFQSAIWRPKNYSTKISNLYFAGAGTTPGIGMPTAIISGHLAVERILRKQ